MRSITGTGRRRARVALLTALSTAVLGLAAIAAPPASANLPGSNFEGNDGNMIVDHSGNTDWSNIGGVNAGVDLPSGSSDNSFGQGTKEDNSAVTVVNGSIPPNKNDLTRFYEASQIGSNGHIYLELGWERLVNIGNANLDFEINQHATAGFTGSTTGPVTLNRTAGDLLVTYDFSGSGNPTLGLLKWLTSAAGNTAGQCFASSSLPCWGQHVTLGSSAAEGAVNTVPITDPLNGNASLGVGLFGEAAIDLTAAGVFPPGICEAFGSTFAKSRSSSSFTAEIKDFIAPIGVNIANCGNIIIRKVTENGDSSFGYTTTGGLTPSTFSLSNGQKQDYGNAVRAGTYSVTENLTAAQQTAGWTLKSLSCTVSGTGTGFTTSGATVNITMAGLGMVDCTYTNHINLPTSLSTNLSATAVNIGDSVHDSAILGGATSNAGGTVTYHAYAGQNVCTGTDLLNSQVTVANGSVPDSAAISFSSAGYYSFQAVYSGDANNLPSTSTCSTELLLVRTNPGIATTLSATTVSLGDSVHDSAKLSGATSDAGGTVTYHAYAGQNVCTGTDLLNSQVTVANASVPDSATLTPTAAGYYSFQAVYSGDTKNNGATSVCSTELLLVKTNPTITTTLSSTSANIGDNIHDSATLHGMSSDAGGTVTYHAYAGQDICTGTDLLNSQVTVANGSVPDSGTFTPTAAGYYSFQAVYSGDTKNNGATSNCSTELLLVRTNPTIATNLSATSIQVGNSASDTALLSGETSDVTGTITFTVYTDSACTMGGQAAGSGPASTSVVPSNSITFNSAGTHYWQAVYSGDLKNNPATSPCTSEQLVVTPLQPGVSTAQNLIPNDSFTLSGGFNPTGSITMSLFAPTDATCSGPPALSQTVSVAGNGTYSTSNTTFIATAEGTWRWMSSYSGDHNNTAANSLCGTEQFTIANH